MQLDAVESGLDGAGGAEDEILDGLGYPYNSHKAIITQAETLVTLGVLGVALRMRGRGFDDVLRVLRERHR